MAVEMSDFVFDGSGHFSIKDVPTSVHVDKGERPHLEELTTIDTVRMGELQDRLYADAREGLVIILQAMDAAGKDSTVKRVMSGVNPTGVEVANFKVPSSTDLAHDYLWRVVPHLPARGKIAIFNRSYYEDVLVVRVHGLWRSYRMPARCLDLTEEEFFDRRYREIRDFERHLWENGYRVLKIFLNVSADEQRKRFLQRIDDESKNWKFSANDLAERRLWPQYQRAYEQAIDATATKRAPWYVIPADQKWVARWLIGEAIVGTLEEMDPRYPAVSAEQKAELARCREELAG